jgi:hypothetical protein
MAIIESNKLDTLAEVNRLAGNIELGNLLAEFAMRNSFLDEVPWHPTTHGSHTEEYRAKSLGKGDFTRINGGVPQLGSTGDLIKENVQLYEGESIVDTRLFKFADDPARIRFIRDKLNMEGFIQDFNYRLLYGSKADNPDAIKSFVERRPKVDDETCFSAGGTGTELTSAWLFEFGMAGTHLIYNKAGSPGFKHEDRGEKYGPAPDGKGNYTYLVSHFEICAGISIGISGSCIRYCNIATDPDDTDHHFKPQDLILKMKQRLPTPGGSQAVLFVPRSIYGQIENHAYEKGNAYYTLSNIEGFGQVLRIVGIPIRPWDTISEKETEVQAA